ncbi:MAG: anti-sigma factor family protein [Fimbriimonas sp.]
MNCKAVQNRLSSYLDRELPADDMMEIRAHLHDCADCQMEEQALRSLKSILCGARTPEPPADLAERLTAAVMAEREPVVTRRGFRLSSLSFAGVAACSMAITYVVLSTVRPVEANPSVATSKSEPSGLAFEIQRDQAFAAGTDATFGPTMFSVADERGR